MPTMNDSGLLRKRIEMARTDGRLNIAAMGLSEFPREVSSMYDLETLDASKGAWYESVDIRRLNAAENELQQLDEIFPDCSAEDLRKEYDETKGTIFGGLEVLDLHGNLLQSVPVGLRHLEHLTVLNLSKNRLANGSLDTISRIHSLKELRLADNAFNGTLSKALYRLKDLETLDIHGNALSELPDGLQELTNLRILDISNNRLRSFPFGAIEHLQLTELNIGHNRLSGTLLPSYLKGLPTVKSLDVSGNALSSVCDDGTVTMPKLQSLSLGDNRLTTLPDLSQWADLVNLSVNNNNIAAMPEGITLLMKLRNVDFTGNNLKKLDDGIGMMESLVTLSIANNPLRERRFLTMGTDNVKRELRNRLVPPEADGLDNSGALVENESRVVMAGVEASQTWPLKAGGVLDRSSTSLRIISASDLEPLRYHPVRSLIAHHNALGGIPTCITLIASNLTALDFSHNKMTGISYICEPLELPRLRDLSLASNTITSLSSLLTQLSAPEMQLLNVSYNRLTAMPNLRTTYPALTTLVASDNSIADLPVDSVRGLQVCDVSRNDIVHLEPALGLLEADGLRMLGVEGNRFRVPRRDVVEKGTGAVLAWLRDKIPLE